MTSEGGEGGGGGGGGGAAGVRRVAGTGPELPLPHPPFLPLPRPLPGSRSRNTDVPHSGPIGDP